MRPLVQWPNVDAVPPDSVRTAVMSALTSGGGHWPWTGSVAEGPSSCVCCGAASVPHLAVEPTAVGCRIGPFEGLWGARALGLAAGLRLRGPRRESALVARPQLGRAEAPA